MGSTSATTTCFNPNLEGPTQRGDGGEMDSHSSGSFQALFSVEMASFDYGAACATRNWTGLLFSF